MFQRPTLSIIFKYMTYSKHVPVNIPQHPFGAIVFIHVQHPKATKFYVDPCWSQPSQLFFQASWEILFAQGPPSSAVAWKWKLLQKALNTVLMQLSFTDLKGILLFCICYQIIIFFVTSILDMFNVHGTLPIVRSFNIIVPLILSEPVVVANPC